MAPRFTSGATRFGLVLLGLALLAGGRGCSQMSAIEGWVAEGRGANSAFMATDLLPAKPDRAVANAIIEMWTPDGEQLLCREPVRPDGGFSVGHSSTTSYRQVLLRAYAPGHEPLETDASPNLGVLYAVIELVPLNRVARPDARELAKVEARLLAETKDLERCGPRNCRQRRALDSLALFYYGQGRHAEAGPLLERSLASMEREGLSRNAGAVWFLRLMAENGARQGKFDEAQVHYDRAIASADADRYWEGLSVADTAASVWVEHGQYARAEAVIRRAIVLCEEKGDRYRLRFFQQRLAWLYADQEKADEAVECYRPVIAALEEEAAKGRCTCGHVCSNLADALDDYAALLRKVGRPADADQQAARAAEVRARRAKAPT
jgi:tetratricopeptide (TPR) repeat protein